MRKQVILGADVAASCEISYFITTGCMRQVKADPAGRFRDPLGGFYTSLKILTFQPSGPGSSRTFLCPSEILSGGHMTCCRGFGRFHCQIMIANTCARWGSVMTRPAVRCCSSSKDFSMQRRQKEDLRANKLKPSRKLSAKRRSTRFTSLRSISWSRAFPRRQDKSLSPGLLKFGDKDARLIDPGKQCLGKTGRRWRYKQGARAHSRCARGRCKHRHWDSLRVLHILLGSLLVGTFLMRLMCNSNWLADDSAPAALAKFDDSSNFCTRSGPKSGVRIRTATTWRFPRMIQFLYAFVASTLSTTNGWREG